MRISLFIPTLEGGGAERVFVNLANFFASKNIEAHLIVGNARGPFRELVSPKVQLIDCAVKKTPHAIAPFLAHVWRIRPDALITTLDMGNAILALTHPFLPKETFLVGRQARPRTESTITRGIRSRVITRMVDIAFRKADLVIANSYGTKKSIEGIRGIWPDKITVVPNPVLPRGVLAATTTGARPDSIRRDDESILIVSAGRLVYEKGFDILIEAFARISSERPSRLRIFGEGPEKNRLQRHAEKLGIPDLVEFAGFSKDLIREFSKANVFVLASRWEGFGNVIVEALAAGVPVVSTDSSGPSEILDFGRYGMIVPSENVDALTEGIRNSLLSPIDSCLLRGRAADFSIEAVGGKYLECILQGLRLQRQAAD